MKNKLYYQFAGSCFLLVFMFLGYVVRFIQPGSKALIKRLLLFVVLSTAK